MTPLILIVLVLVSAGAVAVAFVPAFSGNNRADKRRKALKGNYREVRQTIQADRQRDQRRKSVQQALKVQSQQVAQRKKRVSLEVQIWQAGMKIKKGAFIRNAVILGIGVAVIAWVLNAPPLFAGIFGLAAGYVLPKFYLKRRRKKYQSKFLDELPNAVEAIVRGVKSGMPLNDSLRVVARDVKEPVRTEFARVLDQQNFGKSMTEAIQILYDRVPTSEVNFFVVVITVQQQAGGNLSEALTNLSRVLRNRKKMQAKVKAMSSEAKASAMIIGSLPFVVGSLVSVVTPGYLSPLFTTSLGLFWLGIATVMMSLGIFIMNRMVQFDY